MRPGGRHSSPRCQSPGPLLPDAADRRRRRASHCHDDLSDDAARHDPPSLPHLPGDRLVPRQLCHRRDGARGRDRPSTDRAAGCCAAACPDLVMHSLRVRGSGAEPTRERAVRDADCRWRWPRLVRSSGPQDPGDTRRGATRRLSTMPQGEGNRDTSDATAKSRFARLAPANLDEPR